MRVSYAPLIVATLLAQCTVFADECVDTTTTGSQTSVQSTTSVTTSTASTTTSSTAASASIDSGESLAVVEPVIACSDLASVDLTSVGGNGTNITEASETEVDGVSYCYLEGYLPPQAKWMIRLPISTWTQRYLQAGCGGLCGADQVTLSVVAAEGSDQYENGHFAVATTDMDGGTDGSFALNDDAFIDFAYLAVHNTAEVAKALIKQYYGHEQAFAYFNGCSDGGREAVMSALRYPEDFNGIVAGAPAFLFQFQNSFHHAWVAHSNLDANDAPIFNPSRVPILYDAVIAACDALDGVEDGLLSDPRACSFDPRTIQCADDADNSTCLTTAEAQVAYDFYTGPIDEASGEHLTVGELQYGSENAWVGVGIPATDGGTVLSESIALSALRYLIFEDAPGPNYTLDDFVFANSTIDLLRPHHPFLDAVSPDLSAFHEAGGKLILWHGWADQHISPRTTIQYHEKLIETMGADAVDDFNRMYIFPGVWHCGSGEGMASFDLLTPMLDWVEADSAPHEIMTSTEEDSSESGSSSTTYRTRPAYPYPSVAKYSGSGDVNDAANWVEGDALYSNLTAYWLGVDFFDVFTPVMQP
uniref:feruloyl esterase n=1 Tax=Phytophthora ramorum TaxID=164328 RepID=H3GR75_PHYRM